MPKYAKDTTVSVDKSQSELRSMLTRYGATNYVMGSVDRRIAIMFEVHGRRVRLALPTPELEPDDLQKTEQYSHRKVKRSDAELRAILDQKERQVWRILLLVIKGKIELIETGAVTFEDEFLPYTMLPNGSTVGEWVAPQMDHVVQTGQMPSMLPGLHAAATIALGERSGS